MKGRIAWVFWLVVVLAVLTSTASYAWLAMNVSSRVRGIEVEAISDSIFLEISAYEGEGYGKDVSFGRVMYSLSNDESELSLVTCGRLPEYGAVRVEAVRISTGKYDGTGKYYMAVRSDIAERDISYIDITSNLKTGDSLIGYYIVMEGRSYTESNTIDYYYYYKDVRPNGIVDYVCIGMVPVGEKLSNRLFWGYAYSNNLDEAQKDNTLNIVSLDLPPVEKGYALKNTVYLRCAAGTGDVKNLRVNSVEIEGRNYLEDTIRIMFVAKSDSGETVTRFYSHRNPEEFDDSLFANILGDGKEVVTVDIYVFFDGADPDAYDKGSIYTRSDVTVKFSIDDHDYN